MPDAERATDALCPACGSEGSAVFFETGPVPVHANVLCTTAREARDAARARIVLARCPGCGLIFNAAFDPGLLEYTGDYENPLHFSPRFRSYAQALAEDLVRRHGLQDKSVVEVGCGDGKFLATLCELGGNRGTGFDPSQQAGARAVESTSDVRIVSGLFGREHAEHVDFLCCRHVLEHIGEPRSFLTEIRGALADRPDASLYFEVPNGLFTLEHEGIWDIIYEHCTYFTPASLESLFARSGFDVSRVAVEYGEQFLALEARPAPSAGAATGPPAREAELAARFADAYAAKRDVWSSRLTDLAARGRTAAIWGAGSKGTTFLNVLDVSTEVIPTAVDLNPRKSGRFVPGTAQRIVAPEDLESAPPDLVVVMNPIYEEEIRTRLSELGLAPDVLVA